MFGDSVTTEITANLLQTAGYPPSLSIVMSIFIAIIPLTKVPLAARPIVSTLELFSGLDPHAPSPRPLSHRVLGLAIRVSVVILFVLIAIVFPAFDSIMAFMGSSLCFTICVILPLLFYLRIFGDKVSLRERLFDYFLIAACSVLALVGTVWAFLPKRWVGAD
jgi:vesicular inhibitory amino acid transporter